MMCLTSTARILDFEISLNLLLARRVSSLQYGCSVLSNLVQIARLLSHLLVEGVVGS